MSIFTPDEQFDYDLAVALDGNPALEPLGRQAALEKQLLAIAKQVTRQARKARDENAPHMWPRRVLRWKGPGRGA